ncbi:MAG: aldehyde dehydrogenase family protein [bacterium]
MFSRATRKHLKTATPFPEIDEALAELGANAKKLAAMPISQRVGLLRRCGDDTRAVAKKWVRAACGAKGIGPKTPLAGEEWLAGPWCVLRFTRLLAASLEQIASHGRPRLPGKARRGPQGQAIVRVFPTDWRDRLLYAGIEAKTWMQPGVTPETLEQNMAGHYRSGQKPAGISLVLGAGNVSSIAPTDVLSRVFSQGRVVLLKMHPVNAYLGPIFQRALAALIEEGLVRIVYGGPDAGAYAIGHEAVDDVHITGAIATHDAIVWGAEPAEQARRRAADDPLLKKPISSELGNVSPVIVVPGRFTARELRFQAENVVSMVTNNGSFNCNAAKMVLTWKDWPQRQAFLDAMVLAFTKAPLRKAYYPGAKERYARFTEKLPVARIGEPGPDELPWSLIHHVPPDPDSIYFREEAFCGVLAESALEGREPVDFLARATAFANEKMWGTLNACLIVPRAFRWKRGRRAALEKAVADLRYGTIGINIWPAIGYAVMSSPWGGWQGEGIGLQDVQSGLGWVHNAYMLDKAQKTVFRAPSTTFPKPPWFASHRTAHKLGPKLVALEHRPSWAKLPGIVFTALRG